MVLPWGHVRITRKARFRNRHLHHWPLCERPRHPSHASDLISSLLAVPWVTVELQIGLRLHLCKSWGCSRLPSALKSKSTQMSQRGTGFLPIWTVSGPHQVLGCFRSPCPGNLSPWQQGTHSRQLHISSQGSQEVLWGFDHRDGIPLCLGETCFKVLDTRTEKNTFTSLKTSEFMALCFC